MEPHGPYLPPEEILESFDTGGFTLSDVDELWDRWFAERPELGGDSTDTFSAEEREALELFYLAQARYLDRELRRLDDFVEREIGYDDATLLFTSDHGEEFFEHGDLAHRPKLIDELLHVPLIAYSDDSKRGA